MTTPTHCGHAARYIVQADEGTAYCVDCELKAVAKATKNLDLRYAKEVTPIRRHYLMLRQIKRAIDEREVRK